MTCPTRSANAYQMHTDECNRIRVLEIATPSTGTYLTCMCGSQLTTLDTTFLSASLFASALQANAASSGSTTDSETEKLPWRGRGLSVKKSQPLSASPTWARVSRELNRGGEMQA